jgi:hypothetical protein
MINDVERPRGRWWAGETSMRSHGRVIPWRLSNTLDIFLRLSELGRTTMLSHLGSSISDAIRPARLGARVLGREYIANELGNIVTIKRSVETRKVERMPANPGQADASRNESTQDGPEGTLADADGVNATGFYAGRGAIVDASAHGFLTSRFRRRITESCHKKLAHGMQC